MDWMQVALQAVHWLAGQPAVQGGAIAIITEAVKKAPVGPSGGNGVRMVAALLAVASAFAQASLAGDVSQADPQAIGQAVIEAVSAFLAAVGAWQLARKSQA